MQVTVQFSRCLAKNFVNCTPHRQINGLCTCLLLNVQLQSSINSAMDGNGWLATLGLHLHWNNCYNREISWFIFSNLSFLYQKLPLFCKKKNELYHQLKCCISGRYCNVWSIQTGFAKRRLMAWHPTARDPRPTVHLKAHGPVACGPLPSSRPWQFFLCPLQDNG